MKYRSLRKKFIVLGLAVAMALTACSPDADAYKPVDYEVTDIQQEQNGSVSDNTVSTPPPQGLMAISERYESDGKMESYLTGEWIDTEIATRRPMAVMIPNNRNALPQYGVSYADVIYEAPMEKCSCTRLMGIFQNYGDLEYIDEVTLLRALEGRVEL